MFLNNSAVKAEEIGLTILDIVMPHASGLDVREAVHARRPDLSVLFTTGYFDSRSPDPFLDDDRTELLEKPVHPTMLLETVSTLIAEGARRRTSGASE